MEEAGIIRRSDSPWASTLHVVPKPDKSWRPCGDYRRLNNVTKPDYYPLPNICDFANNLKHCTVFSKLNLVKGYQHLMDRIFKGLPFVFIYLDVLEASRGWGLHLKHLWVVLELLVQNGLVLNLEKCSFALLEIDYLGHKVTTTGIIPLRRHVEALLLQPRPQDSPSYHRCPGW